MNLIWINCMMSLKLKLFDNELVKPIYQENNQLVYYRISYIDSLKYLL